MLDQELLKMLVCPETKQNLELADEGLLTRINEEVDKKALWNRGGRKVEQKMDAALIREDKEFFYPVRDDIPIMLIDEAIDFKRFR